MSKIHISVGALALVLTMTAHAEAQGLGLELSDPSAPVREPPPAREAGTTWTLRAAPAPAAPAPPAGTFYASEPSFPEAGEARPRVGMMIGGGIMAGLGLGLGTLSAFAFAGGSFLAILGLAGLIVSSAAFVVGVILLIVGSIPVDRTARLRRQMERERLRLGASLGRSESETFGLPLATF